MPYNDTGSEKKSHIKISMIQHRITLKSQQAVFSCTVLTSAMLGIARSTQTKRSPRVGIDKVSNPYLC